MINKNRFILVSFLAASLALTGYQHYQADKLDSIIIGVDGDLAPFTYINDKGMLEGYSVDVINEVANAMKLKTEYRVISRSELKQKLKEKKIDAILGPYGLNDTFAENTITSYPFYTNRLVVATKDALEIDNSAQLRELDNFVICSLHNKYLMENIRRIFKYDQISFYEDPNVMYKALESNLCTAILDNRAYITHFVKKNNLKNIALGRVDSEYNNRNYGLIIDKSREDIQEKVNIGIKFVIDSNRLNQINNKWFGSYY